MQLFYLSKVFTPTSYAKWETATVVKTGVRQGGMISALLFNPANDWVM